MTLSSLKKLAQEMVSGRNQIPKITSIWTKEHLRRDADLGDDILAMIAVIEAADAMSFAATSIGHGGPLDANKDECPLCRRAAEFDAARAKL